MSIIARHAGAPYVNGEILHAGTVSVPDELELDLIRLFDEFNGGIDDSNISGTAGIQGSKIAPATIDGAKIAPASVLGVALKPDTVESRSIADGAVLRDNLQEESVTNLVGGAGGVSVLVTVGIGFTKVAELSVVTGDEPNTVIIIWSAPVDMLRTANCNVQIRRGSETVYSSSDGQNAIGDLPRPQISAIAIDQSAPAGSNLTYSVWCAMSRDTADIGPSETILLNARR